MADPDAAKWGAIGMLGTALIGLISRRKRRPNLHEEIQKLTKLVESQNVIMATLKSGQDARAEQQNRMETWLHDLGLKIDNHIQFHLDHPQG